VNPRIGWGQPPPGWQAPGWAPLVDPGSRPLQAARSVGRWWWPTLTMAGLLAVLAYVVDHNPTSPGLSSRGLLTVALAAAVVALLTIHRRYGPRRLARAVAEYATVALLAALLAAPSVGVDQQPANQADSGQARAQTAAGEDQPAILRAVTKVARAGAKVVRGVTGAVRWLVDLWRQASHKADAAKGEALANPAPSPTPAVLSIWRSHA
jgi:gas vesicle protein